MLLDVINFYGQEGIEYKIGKNVTDISETANLS